MLLVIIVILLSHLLALALLWTSQKTLGPALANRLHGASFQSWSLPSFSNSRRRPCLSTTPRSSGHCLLSSPAYLLFLTEASESLLGLYFLREKDHALQSELEPFSLRLASTGTGSSASVAVQSFNSDYSLHNI